MEEQPVAFAIIALSPKSCERSLRYGVSPQPAQAPENSKSGRRSCTSVGLGDVEEEVPVRALGFAERHLGLHRERTRAAFFFGLYRAVVGAEAAAGAVFRSDLYGEGFAGEVFPFRVGVLEGLGSIVKELLVVDLGAYRRVRADEHALTALDAEVRIPDGDVYRYVPLLVLRGSGREGAVLGQRGDGEAVAFEDHHGAEHVFDELGARL